MRLAQPAGLMPRNAGPAVAPVASMR